MGFSSLLFLSAALAHASGSPIAQRHRESSSDSKGPIVWATETVTITTQPIHSKNSILAPTRTRGLKPPHPHAPHSSSTPSSVDKGGNSHGGGMKPIVGRAVDGEIGLQVVTVAADLSPDATLGANTWGTGCTTTITPAWGYGGCPSWDSTETIYPTTTVLYTSVNCRGCDHVYVDGIRFCPNRVATTTKRVSTASTFWLTVCQSSSLLGRNVELETPATTTAGGPGATLTPVAAPSPLITSAPKATAALGARQGAAEIAACPTTYIIPPEKSAGRTLTTYSRYTTTTVFLNCGGCPLVVSTALQGIGPLVSFTKTTTLPVGTKTAYACR